MYSEPVAGMPLCCSSGRGRWPLTSGCEPFVGPAAPCARSLSETISEASYMREAVEMMPETLEYGILNANMLHFLRDVMCHVSVGGGRQPSEAPRKQAVRSSGFQAPSWALSLHLCL